MSIDLRAFLLFIHILLGITWLGGILFVGWGVYPSASKLPYNNQREFLTKMMQHTHILLTIAGASVIGTGILLGTFFGRLRTVNFYFQVDMGNYFC